MSFEVFHVTERQTRQKPLVNFHVIPILVFKFKAHVFINGFIHFADFIAENQ